MVKRYRRCYQLRVSSFKRKLNSSDRECLLRPLISRERNTIQETSWISKVKKIVFSGNIFFRRSREVHSSWKFFWSIIILIVSRTIRVRDWYIIDDKFDRNWNLKRKIIPITEGKKNLENYRWSNFTRDEILSDNFIPRFTKYIFKRQWIFFFPSPSNACRNFKIVKRVYFTGEKTDGT